MLNKTEKGISEISLSKVGATAPIFFFLLLTTNIILCIILNREKEDEIMIVEKKGIVYELDENTKTGKVKYSDCMIQEANILSNIDGYVINEIASKAFFHDEKLKSVIIPDTVRKIKNSSFEGCKRLRSINHNGALTVDSIGFYAFRNCAIRAINLSRIKTIGKGAFENCENMLLLCLPNDSISVLEEDVTNGCTSLQEFIFPESLIKVKNNFQHNFNLKKMVFNNPNLEVIPFIKNISKEVILFGHQDSKVQEIAIYGYHFMLMDYMD